MAYPNGQYPPEALAPIYQGELITEAAAGWNALNVEARDNGVELYPTGSMSSYRTYEEQEYLYQQYLNGTGNLAAVPGNSNHGTGIAVDVATTEMRDMIDRIGSKYGWSKSWSDAPSEWWHICYQSGHYSGPDPGPRGEAVKPVPEVPTVSAVAVLKQNACLELFIEDSGGSVWHCWQAAPNAGWSDWHSMGKP